MAEENPQTQNNTGFLQRIFNAMPQSLMEGPSGGMFIGTATAAELSPAASASGAGQVVTWLDTPEINKAPTTRSFNEMPTEEQKAFHDGLRPADPTKAIPPAERMEAIEKARKAALEAGKTAKHTPAQEANVNKLIDGIKSGTSTLPIKPDAAAPVRTSRPDQDPSDIQPPPARTSRRDQDPADIQPPPVRTSRPDQDPTDVQPPHPQEKSPKPKKAAGAKKQGEHHPGSHAAPGEHHEKTHGHESNGGDPVGRPSAEDLNGYQLNQIYAHREQLSPDGQKHIDEAQRAGLTSNHLESVDPAAAGAIRAQYNSNYGQLRTEQSKAPAAATTSLATAKPTNLLPPGGLNPHPKPDGF